MQTGEQSGWNWDVMASGSSATETLHKPAKAPRPKASYSIATRLLCCRPTFPEMVAQLRGMLEQLRRRSSDSPPHRRSGPAAALEGGPEGGGEQQQEGGGSSGDDAAGVLSV